MTQDISTQLPKILYIDDESINLRLFQISFKKFYDITTAESGEEGLEILKENKFDVIVSDQRMPGMSGTEFMAAAKEYKSDSKFILLTGYTDIEALEKAVNKVGLWQFIKKPWEPSNFKIIIDNAFTSLKTERENKIISAALRQEEERLSLALEGTNAGVWDWNFKTNEVYYSPTWKLMLGYQDNEIENDVKTWENLLHPDDLQKSFNLLDSYLNNKISHYELEFRMKHKQGHYVNILSRGRGTKDSNGEYERLTGTHIDLSDKYTAQNEIKKLNEDLEERVDRRTKALKLLNIQLIQRNKFEHLISKISSELIGVTSNQVEYQINQALKDINSFSHADNSFVFQINSSQCLTVMNECSSNGSTSNLYKTFNNHQLKDLPLISGKLKNNEVLIIKNVGNIPIQYNYEKEIFIASNIYSLLIIPLKLQSGLFGCFGISFSKPDRDWNPEDISLLKFIGEIFTNALHRSYGELELMDREKRLSEANRIILANEKKTKLLQNIASVANSPLEINEALVHCQEILLNQNAGLFGALYQIKNNSTKKLLNIITKELSNQKSFADNLSQEKGVIHEIIEAAIKDKSIKIKNEQQLTNFSPGESSVIMDIASIPILVDNNVHYLFLTLNKSQPSNATELKVLEEIAREISFVAERDITRGELRKSLEKEKELGELKSQFISMASHQFRTPLTVIQSNVELFQMLAEQIDSSVKGKFDKISLRIKEEIVRLTELMNDVLLLGKLNANVLKADIKDENLKSIITDIIEKINQIQLDGRKCDFKLVGLPYQVQIDRGLFSHSFTNLLENAFKYSKGAKNPQVIIYYDHHKTKIEVIDFGRGIPKENLKNLFQPFYRADNTVDIEGTGLGLVVCEKYLALQNAEITVESTENESTKFSIIIPK